MFDPKLSDARHCNLQDKLWGWLVRKSSLNIGLLGGSASAMPCPGASGFKFLDKLRQGLEESFPQAGPIQTHNHAAGAVSTSWSAVQMESALDMNGTDILVWEYAINDNGSGSHGSDTLEAMMDLWLHRVASASAALPNKPAVVLLYLWNRIPPGAPPGAPFPLSKAWDSHERVIEHYAAQGMDISVLQVAGGIGGPHAKSAVRDGIHPTCNATTFIADIMRRHLLTQLKSAAARHHRGSTTEAPSCSLSRAADALVQRLPQAQRYTSGDRILDAIASSPTIKVVSEWLPRNSWPPLKDHLVALRAGLPRGLWAPTMMAGTKSIRGRLDEKRGFRLRTCGLYTGPLKLSFDEEGVAAVALGFNDLNPLSREGPWRFLEAVRIEINGLEAKASTEGDLWRSFDEAHHYLPFWHLFQQPSKLMSISACVEGEAAAALVKAHKTLWPQLCTVVIFKGGGQQQTLVADGPHQLPPQVPDETQKLPLAEAVPYEARLL